MDNVILIPSTTLGLIFIGVYWFRCRLAKKEFNHGIMVNTVLQSSGIVCGLLLMIGVFNEDARKLLKEIDLYIFIAGLVILAASIKGIYSDIFLSTKKGENSSTRVDSSEAEVKGETAS